MQKLQNYVTGKWLAGEGEQQILYNAVTGEPIFSTSTQGLDFHSILQYGREKGTVALQRLTFHERAAMLKALALHLQKHLNVFYQLSYMTGATKADSWIDIEGGIGNLFSYASLRKKLPNENFLLEGEMVKLSKTGSFIGHHILVPKEGIAIHINAFNFPVWGMLEKIAVNLLAGVAALVKPATITCFLTEAVVREIIASQILPEGALQLICGSAGNMLNYVASQDVITFTGSASTGFALKSHPQVMKENVPFNMEADSLNCIVLGEDVTPSMPEWTIFLKEIRKEITVKAGQKCTAIRRIFVPGERINQVQEELVAMLSQVTIGNPLNESVRMGSLAGLSQVEEVKSRVQALLASSQLVYTANPLQLIDAHEEKGAFLSPVLLRNDTPFTSAEVHEVEAFGPVATLMPYHNTEEAIALSKKGKGSLVSTIVTANHAIAKQYVLNAASYHGRILILNAQCAKDSTGHGSPLPSLIHGGPGRAGGGEEMGGLRGLTHYMQRTAIQGAPDFITAIGGVFQPGSKKTYEEIHPFYKYFDELQIGESYTTAKRTITEGDIMNFAHLSWDHFYAHTDYTSLEDTLFSKPVAHGYFILSAAAGLFVPPKKGTVLLNYGIDELRFTQPVHAGDTIWTELTVKEKIITELKTHPHLPRGIVKWYVEIWNQENELVGVATILTLVKKQNS